MVKGMGPEDIRRAITDAEFVDFRRKKEQARSNRGIQDLQIHVV